MRARRRWCLYLSLAAAGTVARPGATQIAVVVHPTNPIQDVSLADLRRLYVGARLTWPAGQRVTLLESPPAAAKFYRVVLGMSTDLVARHWMGVVFRGEEATPPKAIVTGDELVRFVAEHAGAIGFVPVAAVSSRVKVIAVDGLRPTDSGYRLR
jgi:hypothetical protein